MVVKNGTCKLNELIYETLNLDRRQIRDTFWALN